MLLVTLGLCRLTQHMAQSPENTMHKCHSPAPVESRGPIAAGYTGRVSGRGGIGHGSLAITLGTARPGCFRRGVLGAFGSAWMPAVHTCGLLAVVMSDA